MKKSKQLAATLATALAVTTLAGASAFAESRPTNETRGRIERRDGSHRERDANRGESRRGDDSRRGETDGQTHARDNAQYNQRNRSDDRQSNGTWRGDSRDRNDSRHRSDDRNNNRGNDRGDYRNNNRGNDRNDNRGYDRNRSGQNRSYGSRQPYHVNGRISRVVRYGSGYRIWVGGASYPFFVPLAYYRGDRFRVGLSINLGGYYNPLGYYDYYDGVYDNRSYSRGDLRGVVESVDYRRDTFVVRSEASGSFVTVAMRRRDEGVRPGDYVEVSGDWTRTGYFQAYDVDVLD